MPRILMSVTGRADREPGGDPQKAGVAVSADQILFTGPSEEVEGKAELTEGCTVIDAMGADIERVDVTSLDEGTFYADLVIESDGEQLTISSRPSDAIALATRTGSPVFATRDLLDEAGVEIHDDTEEEEIERFREFLDENLKR